MSQNFVQKSLLNKTLSKVKHAECHRSGYYYMLYVTISTMYTYETYTKYSNLISRTTYRDSVGPPTVLLLPRRSDRISVSSPGNEVASIYLAGKNQNTILIHGHFHIIAMHFKDQIINFEILVIKIESTSRDNFFSSFFFLLSISDISFKTIPLK